VCAAAAFGAAAGSRSIAGLFAALALVVVAVAVAAECLFIWWGTVGALLAFVVSLAVGADTRAVTGLLTTLAMVATAMAVSSKCFFVWLHTVGAWLALLDAVAVSVRVRCLLTVEVLGVVCGALFVKCVVCWMLIVVVLVDIAVAMGVGRVVVCFHAVL
jgi:hypothetical protein